MRLHYLSIDPATLEAAEQTLHIDRTEFRISPHRFKYFDKVIYENLPVYAGADEFTPQDILPEVHELVIQRLMEVCNITAQTRWIFLPLVEEDRPSGMLWMWGNHLESGDLPAASIFASQVSIALENARLFSEIQRLVVTDDLTQLYNRRGILEVSKYEFDRAKRYNRPLSVLLVDVDHFKSINDLYGHPSGDLVLYELGKILKSQIRSVDKIGRLGGEEFVILLPETSINFACQVAERLRLVVEKAGLQAPPNEQSIHVTLSIGVAALTPDDPDLYALIGAADQAMYRAKDSGRNRVLVSERP
jgi:diguanylate cyclase (GGDEF)-like protein